MAIKRIEIYWTIKKNWSYLRGSYEWLFWKVNEQNSFYTIFYKFVPLGNWNYDRYFFILPIEHNEEAKEILVSKNETIDFQRWFLWCDCECDFLGAKYYVSKILHPYLIWFPHLKYNFDFTFGIKQNVRNGFVGAKFIQFPSVINYKNFISFFSIKEHKYFVSLTPEQTEYKEWSIKENIIIHDEKWELINDKLKTFLWQDEKNKFSFYFHFSKPKANELIDDMNDFGLFLFPCLNFSFENMKFAYQKASEAEDIIFPEPSCFVKILSTWWNGKSVLENNEYAYINNTNSYHFAKYKWEKVCFFQAFKVENWAINIGFVGVNHKWEKVFSAYNLYRAEIDVNWSWKSFNGDFFFQWSFIFKDDHIYIMDATMQWLREITENWFEMVFYEDCYWKQQPINQEIKIANFNSNEKWGILGFSNLVNHCTSTICYTKKGIFKEQLTFVDIPKMYDGHFVSMTYWAIINWNAKNLSTNFEETQKRKFDVVYRGKLSITNMKSVTRIRDNNHSLKRCTTVYSKTSSFLGTIDGWAKKLTCGKDWIVELRQGGTGYTMILDDNTKISMLYNVHNQVLTKIKMPIAPTVLSHLKNHFWVVSVSSKTARGKIQPNTHLGLLNKKGKIFLSWQLPLDNQFEEGKDLNF